MYKITKKTRKYHTDSRNNICNIFKNHYNDKIDKDQFPLG